MAATHPFEESDTADRVGRVLGRRLHVVREADRVTDFVGDNVFDQAPHERIRHRQRLRSLVERTRLDEVPVLQELRDVVEHVDLTLQDLA